MKRLRKQRVKKKQKEIAKRNDLGQEAYEESLKHEKSLKERVQTALWDYDHKQYPMCKIPTLLELLKERKEEILKTEEAFTNIEMKKIQVILNGFSD